MRKLKRIEFSFLDPDGDLKHVIGFHFKRFVTDERISYQRFLIDLFPNINKDSQKMILDELKKKNHLTFETNAEFGNVSVEVYYFILEPDDPFNLQRFIENFYEDPYGELMTDPNFDSEHFKTNFFLHLAHKAEDQDAFLKELEKII